MQTPTYASGGSISTIDYIFIKDVLQTTFSTHPCKAAQHWAIYVDLEIPLLDNQSLGLQPKKGPAVISSANLKRLQRFLPDWAAQYRKCFPSPPVQQFYDGIIEHIDSFADTVERNVRPTKTGWQVFLSEAECSELDELEAEAGFALQDYRLHRCTLCKRRSAMRRSA